jgi:hypothetical protein
MSCKGMRFNDINYNNNMAIRMLQAVVDQLSADLQKVYLFIIIFILNAGGC